MVSVQKDIFEQFSHSVDWTQLLERNRAIVCALSGGPDSVSLCLLLHKLSGEIDFRLIVAHLNHGIRGDDADSDEQFVREFCENQGIFLETVRSDIPARAEYERISIEMAARLSRYEFLGQIAAKHDCNLIALGHNADDRIENLFLRLFRGAGGRGLGSLQPVRMLGGITLVRPLLGISRSEIIKFLDSQNISYRIDKTNLEQSSDRGRVRNVILPAIIELAEESGLGSVRESLSRSAELLSNDEASIQEQVRSCMDRVGFDDMGGLHIPIHEVRDLQSPILERLLLESISRLDPFIRPEREHIEAIEAMVRGERTGACDIPGGFRAEISGDWVTIHCPVECITPSPPEFKIHLEDLPAECDFGPFRLTFSLEETEKERTQAHIGASQETVHITVPENCIFINVRTPEPGDRIAPLGMDSHTKKLSDIFIDRKIPENERPVEPVVLDSSGIHILTLPRLGIVSENARVENDSKAVIRIAVEPSAE